MKERNYTWGILLVALSAASFGVMPILAKIAYAAGTGTSTLLFLRFLTGCLFMFLLMYLRRIPLPSKRECRNFFLLGAVCYVGQSLTFFMALRYASAGVVSLLLYTYPVIVMAGSAVLFRERITRTKLLALVLASAGAFAIVSGGLDATPLGIVLSLISAVIYSVYILASSRLVGPGQGVSSAAFIMLGAAMVYGLLNLIQGFTPPETPAGYIPVVLIALVSTCIAMWSFFAGMEMTGPTVASLVSMFEPVMTVLLSVLILGERLTANMLLGGGLVMAAMYIISMPDRKADTSGGENTEIETEMKQK